MHARTIIMHHARPYNTHVYHIMSLVIDVIGQKVWVIWMPGL